MITSRGFRAFWVIWLFLKMAQVCTAEPFFSFTPLSVDFPQIELRLKVIASPGTPIRPEQFRIWDDQTQVTEFSLASSTARQVLILLLDRSSSLEKEIGDVRKSAAEFLESLPVEVKVSVITFASDIDINQDFTFDKEALLKAIRSIRSWGGTLLYDASYMAIEQLWASSDPRDLRTLVLFTDGRDETPVTRQRMSTRTLEEILAQGKKRGVRIFTVGMGSEIDQGVLKQLAQTTGGGYLFAPSSKELFQAYQTISRKLQDEHHINIRYLVQEAARDGRRHLVRLEGSLNGNPQTATGSYEAPIDPKKPFPVQARSIFLNIGQPDLPPASGVGSVVPAPGPASGPQKVDSPDWMKIRDQSIRQADDLLQGARTPAGSSTPGFSPPQK